MFNLREAVGNMVKSMFVSALQTATMFVVQFYVWPSLFTHVVKPRLVAALNGEETFDVALRIYALLS